MAEDRITSTLMTIVSVVLGICIICSFAIPTVTAQIGMLSDAENAKYGALIGVTVICMIMGLILVVIRGYNHKER